MELKHTAAKYERNKYLQRKPRTTDLRPWLWGASLRGSSEHSPREIAVRGVHKVVTEKIISQGESPDSRPERSVVRGKRLGLCVAKERN